MRTVLALLALVALTQAVSLVDLVKEEWHTFKVSVKIFYYILET